MPSTLLSLAIALIVVGLLAGLLYWLLITTEGVYLGRRVVIWLYDLYASRYERVKGYNAALESRFLARPIMATLAPNDAPLVLDVATGTARLPRALAQWPRFDGVIIGADLSRRMLHYGAGRVAEAMYLGQVYLMHFPAERLPFDDDLFDMVSCLEALEFMHDPKAVIAELVRVLRPGGVLLLTNRVGPDAKLMPGKAWPNDEAERIYREEFGLLDVDIRTWQYDYALVWALKPGDSHPTRRRPLLEIWRCPRCTQKQLTENDGAYVCLNCEARVLIAKDGVIEVMAAQARR